MAALYESIRSLHNQEQYSDLAVICGGNRIFKLHRAIVCPQSGFFEGACSGGFMESLTGKIELPEEDPDIFDKLVQFLYTGGYVDGLMQVHDDEPNPSPAAMLSGKQVHDELGPDHNRERRDDKDDAEAKDSSSPLSYRDLPEAKYQHQVQIKRIENSDVRDACEALRTCVKVYTMADKFLISPLKLLALDRFHALSKDVAFTCTEDYIKIAAELYENAPGDMVMQEMCVRLVFDYCHHVGFVHQLDPIRGAFGTALLQYTLLKDWYFRAQQEADARGDTKDELEALEFKPSMWIQRMKYLETKESASDEEESNVVVGRTREPR